MAFRPVARHFPESVAHGHVVRRHRLVRVFPLEAAVLRVPLPDFRLQKISIGSRDTADFDELRISGTFRDATPIRK